MSAHADSPRSSAQEGSGGARSSEQEGADSAPAGYNFTAAVVDRLARERPEDEALRAIARDGTHRSYSFGDVARETAQTAAGLAASGVTRGDVVLTLMGATPEWVFTMLGAWRLGAVAMPCSEQLRAKDMAVRIEQAKPKLAVIAERDRAELEAAFEHLQRPPRHVALDSECLPSGEVRPPAPTTLEDPALIIFTSGTAGEPRGAIHTQRYLRGQSVQAEHWLGGGPGDLVWCTAASGWSKSARNAFVAPWSRGACCLVHDARFDPSARLDVLAEEKVSVLCQAPTEYRIIAKRTALGGRSFPALRRLVSAGEPLNPEVISVFGEGLGLQIHDGYGQTETGQLTGMPGDGEVLAGSMGKALPGFGLEIVDGRGDPASEGELCLDPETVPTFFHGYLGESRFDGRRWHTGDRVRRDERGYLWFEARLDDVILSAGYRIGPFEVESALVAHPAVVEAAAVAVADEERGSIVKAIVVLRDGLRGDERLAGELQDHVKVVTAPYKYPRVIEFRRSLPKTASGKIKRAQLRAENP